MDGSSTELTLIQRARLAMAGVDTDENLRALVKQSEGILKVDSEDANKEAQTARMLLKNTRITIEKAGKAARDDAQAFVKVVIAEEKRLIAITEIEEKRLQSLQDAYEARLEAEKQAKINAELERTKRIGELLKSLSVDLRFGDDSKIIFEKLEAVKSVQIDERFEEFQEEARKLSQESIKTLEMAYDMAIENERQKAEFEAMKAEMEKVQMAQIKDAQGAQDAQGVHAQKDEQIDEQQKTLPPATDKEALMAFAKQISCMNLPATKTARGLEIVQHVKHSLNAVANKIQLAVDGME